MAKLKLLESLAVLSASVVLFSGCKALPGGTVSDAATIVYTSGASQHTAAVELHVPPDDAFAALVAVVNEQSDVEILERNDKARLLQILRGKERRVTGQVTALGSGSSLLYIWADAGNSGVTGEEIAIRSIELTCDELGVEYEMVNY